MSGLSIYIRKIIHMFGIVSSYIYIVSGLFLYIFRCRITRLMKRKKYLGLSIYDRDWIFMNGIEYTKEELTVCNIGIDFYDRD